MSTLILSKKSLSPDLLGKTFGDYQIISLNKWSKNKQTFVEVQCKHGTDKLNFSNLKAGKQLGCKKCYLERNSLPDLTDPVDNNLYYRFKSITLRCTNPSTHGYKTYKDTLIYSEWIKDPLLFIIYVKALPGFDIHLTIDRIDNNKGYEPGNLRWATLKEQSQNRRTNTYVTWKNERMVISDFARRFTQLSINRTIELFNKGWTLERLVEHVPKERGNRVRYPKHRT